MKYIAQFILNFILGWKIINGFPKLDKFILIAAPHTSWQDFPIGILANFATSLNANFIGKDSLFKPPFGFVFRWLGGAPVDRSKNNRLVQGIIDIYNSKDRFILGMSPEGTRKKVKNWKTGFYYIAKGANVPIVMVALDYKNKKLVISDPYYLTDDMEYDFNYFHNYFKGIEGKNPQLF
jgi:1-acyl-sn-glycerol-3-phosphate acyltransferase